MNNQEKILKVMEPYLAVFPYNKLDMTGLLIYVKALDMAKIDAEKVSVAMLKLLQTHKFFPAVSEIIEAVGELEDFVDEVRGERKKLTAGEAWQEAMGNVRHVGIYGKWKFSTPEAEKAANQFGKMELCMLKEDEVNTARSQFMRLYESIIKREQSKEQNKRVLQSLGPNNKIVALIEKMSMKQIEGN